MPRALKILLLLLVLGFYLFFGIYKGLEYLPNYARGQQFRIDRFRLGFGYILELSQMDNAPDQIHLTRYVKYYEFIKKLKQQDEAIDEILAFCYFYQGKSDQAQKLYMKSIEDNPNLFWSYYNLGMIKLLSHDLTGAADILQKAINLTPEETLNHLSNSKPYLQIIVSNDIPAKVLAQSLQLSHQKAMKYVEVLNAIKSNPTLAAKKEEVLKDLIRHAHLVLF